ncbi:MAG: hypothetical protein ACK4IX_14580 [Candidatus Sericytochromatia bacterium]
MKKNLLTISNKKIVLPLMILFGLTSTASLADTNNNLKQENKNVSFSGDILLEDKSINSKNFLVTVIWGIDRSDKEGGDTWKQSSSVSKVTSNKGKLSYSLSLKNIPSEKEMMTLGDAKLGIGHIIVFNDIDKNGLLDFEKELVGGASNNCITYLKGDLNSFEKIEGKTIHTLKKLNQGYSITKSVSPKEHGLPVVFDDLVPIKSNVINIIVPKDKNDIKFPNWT